MGRSFIDKSFIDTSFISTALSRNSASSPRSL
jgi:hypothetical protein